MADPPQRPLAPSESGYALQGMPDPTEDTTRSLPRAAIDFGLGVGRIIPETYQTAVEAGRTFLGGDQPTGWWQRRAKEAGDAMDWYKGLSSPAEQKVEQRKFFPGPDELSAWQDLPAVAAHQIAGLVPYLFSGLAAKAVTSTPAAAAKVAQVFNIGAMGTQGYGAYNQALRDYFEKTPIDQLNASVPGFSEVASQMGEDAARNEAYKKAWSPVAAVLNASVGAAGGAGISHAVGGMQKAILPRTAIGTGEGLLIGGGMGGAAEYGRQKGLVNVGAQGAINTEKVLMSGAESAVPMGVIVGTTHAAMGKADQAAGKKAETPPPGGGPPADIRMALNEQFPQPGGFGTPGEAWRGPAIRPGVGPEGPVPYDVPPPEGPAGRPTRPDYGRTQPLIPFENVPPEGPPGRPALPVDRAQRFTGEAPEGPDVMGYQPLPGQRSERVQRAVPEGAEPYLPEPTGPRQPIRDVYPQPTGQTATERGPGELIQDPQTGAMVPGRMPSGEGFRGGTRPRPIAAGPTQDVRFTPPPPPGTPPAGPQVPPRLTYRPGREATLPSGAPSLSDRGLSDRAMAEYAATLQPQAPAPAAGGRPAPPAVARERARRGAAAAPVEEKPAAPKVEKGTSRSLKQGDTIVDTDGTRLSVLEARPNSVVVQLPDGSAGELPHDATQITIERAAPAEKPAAPKKAKEKPAAKAGMPDNDRASIQADMATLPDTTDRDLWADRLEQVLKKKGKVEPKDVPEEMAKMGTQGFSAVLRGLRDHPEETLALVRGEAPGQKAPAEAKPAAPKEEKPAATKAEDKPATPEDNIRQVIFHTAGGDNHIRDRWATRLRGIAHAKGRLEYSDLPPELRAALIDGPLLRRLMDDPVSFDRMVRGTEPVEIPELPTGLRREKPGAAKVAEVSKRRTAAAKEKEEPKEPEKPEEKLQAPVTERTAEEIEKEAEGAIADEWVPPNKPEGFDSPTAKEMRKRMRPPGHPKGLPQSWEELIKVVRGQNMVDYLRAQVQALQEAGKVATGKLGQVYVGQSAATVVRRLEKMAAREPLVAVSIDEGWGNTDKNLLQKAAAAAAGVEFDPDRPPPFIGPIQDVPPVQRRAARRQWFNEIRDRPRSDEAPEVIPTAKEALAVMERQLDAWTTNLTKWINEEYPNRKYVHGVSPRDEVMMTPTDRSGGEEYPQWSRIVQIKMKADMFRDLIQQAENKSLPANRRYTAQRTLRKQLEYWSSDEMVGAEAAHEGRKLSSLEMTEAHDQPVVTDETGKKVYGVEALEAGSPGGIVGDVNADADPITVALEEKGGGHLAAVEGGEGGRRAFADQVADVEAEADAELIGFYGQRLSGAGATLERSSDAALISRLLNEYDEYAAMAATRGEKVPSKEELLARLQLRPKVRTALDDLAKVNPDLAEAFEETINRNALIKVDPETGTQRTREFYETDPATGNKRKTPTLQEWDPNTKQWKNVVRQSLVDAEAEGNIVRQATGRSRLEGIGAVGEAMIRSGYLSEETAHRLVSSGAMESLDWAREPSLKLGQEFSDILRHVASALHGEATTLRATTGEREVIDRTREQALREATSEVVQTEAQTQPIRYTTIPPVRHATAADQSRLLRGGRSDIADHLDEVADSLAEHAVTAVNYSGRKPAMRRLLEALNEPSVRQAIDAERKRNNLPGEPLADAITDWFIKNGRVDDMLADIERRYPTEMDVLPAWKPTDVRGDPVLTPLASGVGLAPNDVRARVIEGRPTFVEEPPYDDPMRIFERDPVTKDFVISSLELERRGNKTPTPPKEKVVLPIRPDLAEYERRRSEPAPVDENGRVIGMTGEERLAEHRSVVDRIADYLFARKKPAHYPEEITDDEYVKSSPTRDLTQQMYDRKDPIDVALKKIADQTVGHVPIMVLHPDVYNALMGRLKAPEDTPGYYDWRTDTIYMNRNASDARTAAEAEAWNQYLRHEVGHAMTLGALELNPRAKKAFSDLIDIIKARESYWKGERLEVKSEGRMEVRPGTMSIDDIVQRFKDPHEFVQEIQANKEFRRLMASVPLTTAERTRLAAPQARTVFEAAKEWISRVVNSLFRRSVKDNALTDALAMTFELLQDTVERGRPEYSARRKGLTGAAMGEVVGIRPTLERRWRELHKRVSDLRDAAHAAHEKGQEEHASQILDIASKHAAELVRVAKQLKDMTDRDFQRRMRTGAPGFWDSAIGQKLGASGREIKYRYKKQGGTWGQKAFWTHTLFDLTQWGNNAFKAQTRPVREHVSELYTMAHNYARERGDETLLHALAKMQSSPNADRVASFLLRESKLQMYADAPIGEKNANGKATGKNAHVRPGSMMARQAERLLGAMKEEHDQLARDVPYFNALRKMVHDWGDTVAKDDALAVVNDTAGMDNITRDKDGNVDPVAKSAFVKWVINNKDTPLDAQEKAWIDSHRPDPHDYTGEKEKIDAHLKRTNFDKLVASYRDNPDLARRNGPWVPFKRFGDHAISGNYIFPTMEGVTDKGDGVFEAVDRDTANRFIDAVTDTSGVSLLHAVRAIYDRTTGKLATKIDEHSTFEGGPVDEPGYIVTTREGPRRVTPKEAENDPNLEIRHQLHFNDRHVEFFRKEREAAERLEEMTNSSSPNYNPHVKMRGEVELVSDYGGSQSPHYMSRAMRAVIENATNSWEYKRMTEGERRAWKQRLMSIGAKQVMMAGGRAPGLMRENVEGASKNLLENYAMASAQSAFNHAHYTYGERLRDDFKAIDEHNRQHKDSAGSSDRRAVAEELQRRAYAVNDPFVHGIWGTATNRLLQFTYTAKLAGTSFLGLNALEPWLLYLPMLAAHVGPWQAFKILKQSYKDIHALNLLGRGIEDFKKAALNREDGKWNDYEETYATNLRKSKAADAEEAIRMFDILADRGMFDRSAANEVTLLRQPNPTWGGKVLDRADNAFRGLNTAVEAMNRGAIALSAFRAAKGSFEERVRFAEDMVYRGAGVYAAWNAPPVFNHPVARLALQFKKYPQRVISNYIAAGMAALKGDRVALKQLGYMLGMTAMAAGMFGLPTEVFSIPFNALNILGIGPSWNDITSEAYGMMANQFGPEVAEVIAHGAPRAFNVDLSGRAGQNNLLFFDQPQSNKPQDLKASLAGVLLGAGGSSLMNGIEGIQLTGKALSEAASGSSQRAADYAMQAGRDLMFVKQLADITDAIRKSGMVGTPRSLGGAALGPELTAGELTMKALGVTSGREARYWEGRHVEQRREKESQTDRNVWVQRMATATQAERPGIQRSINEWNQTHGLADQIKPSDVTKAISRRRTEEARPRSELAMPRNKRYETERQNIQRIYNLQGM